jgi:hypothetical protein
LTGGGARPARVRDFWAGGHDWHDADRELGEAIEKLYPPPPPGRLPVPREMAVQEKAFLGRAAEWAAGGVDQFLVLSAGLPGCRDVPVPGGRTVPVRAVHRAALAACGGGGRVLYVDSDPVIVSHAKALTEALDGVTVITGDPRAPGDVLRAAVSRGGLDLARPVAVFLSRFLRGMPAVEAREVAGAYAAATVPGSVLVITCGRCDPPASDPGLWEKIRRTWTAGEVHNHSRQEIGGFFAGTTLVSPGVVPARVWMPEGPESLEGDAAGFVLGGAGIRR